MWNGLTHIKPTLEHVIDRWFRNRQDKQGALVVIYTDGSLSDEKAFVELIRETCLKIDNHTEIKILILGFGSEIEQKPKVIDFYVGVDINYHKFKHNIVIFDLINEMTEGIIPAFVRQLGDNPEKGLAMWVKQKQEYSTVYEKYKHCIE
ncbi:hypothetical protein FJR38_25975 [Anabaena sp. UHCC 0253]|nr:hypothetical protein [Anabaena sp. UHCC 0253]